MLDRLRPLSKTFLIVIFPDSSFTISLHIVFSQLGIVQLSSQLGHWLSAHLQSDYVQLGPFLPAPHILSPSYIVVQLGSSVRLAAQLGQIFSAPLLLSRSCTVGQLGHSL